MDLVHQVNLLLKVMVLLMVGMLPEGLKFMGTLHLLISLEVVPAVLVLRGQVLVEEHYHYLPPVRLL